MMEDAWEAWGRPPTIGLECVGGPLDGRVIHIPPDWQGLLVPSRLPMCGAASSRPPDRVEDRTQGYRRGELNGTKVLIYDEGTRP